VKGLDGRGVASSVHFSWATGVVGVVDARVRCFWCPTAGACRDVLRGEEDYLRGDGRVEVGVTTKAMR